ncbi:MAG TPA: hypothetical protein VJB99_04770 [Patescibacteria group bacterium]|nr:hypothetical protein [Patescibacteria group bacterium]
MAYGSFRTAGIVVVGAVVSLSVGWTARAALGDRISNLGSNIGSGLGTNFGSNFGSGSALQAIGNAVSERVQTAEEKAATETAADKQLDYEALQEKISDRIDAAIGRLNGAIEAINASHLAEGTKGVLTDGLQSTVDLLTDYQTKIAVAQTVEELRLVNEEAKAYLVSQQDVLQENVEAGMQEIGKNTVENLQVFSEKATTSLCALWATCSESREEIERLLNQVSTISGTLQEIENAGSLDILESQLFADLEAKDLEAVQADVQSYATLAQQIVSDAQMVSAACLEPEEESVQAGAASMRDSVPEQCRPTGSR